MNENRTAVGFTSETGRTKSSGSVKSVESLRKYRKYTLVIVLILSAIITPPDVISQIIVAIPIMILYEISIIISAIVYKNMSKKITNP